MIKALPSLLLAFLLAAPTTLCGHDAAGRLSGMSIAGSGWTHATGYLYDSAGRLEHVDLGDLRSTYSYVSNSGLLDTVSQKTNGVTLHAMQRSSDQLGRLQSIASQASVAPTISHSYGYNLANQRTSATREDGRSIAYGYDALGHLNSAIETLSDSSVRAGRSFAYGYDALGNRTDAEFGDSNQIAYTPANGDASQYATIAHPGKVVVTGEADPGASVSVDGRPAAARQGRYFADEIALDNTASPVAASLDIAATLGSVTETRSVEASVPSALSSLEYDADGNLTFDGRNDYTWDAENRLVEISTRSGRETVGAVFPSFHQRMDYDDLGRRTRSRTWHKIGGTEHLVRDDAFVYDGWRLAAVLSGHDGALRQRFAWGLDLSHTVGGAGNAGGLLVFEDTVLGQSHFPRYDGKGNVVGLIAAKGAPAEAPVGTPGAGEMSATYEYDPFGNALAATGHSATRNPFRFGTVLQDPVTRYSYYGYRFYDPAHGRWLSRDPLAEAGGLNLYGFVGNDPINAVDVLGMEPFTQSAAFIKTEAYLRATNDAILGWNANLYLRVLPGILAAPYDLGQAIAGATDVLGYELGMAVGNPTDYVQGVQAAALAQYRALGSELEWQRQLWSDPCLRKTLLDGYWGDVWSLDYERISYAYQELAVTTSIFALSRLGAAKAPLTPNPYAGVQEASAYLRAQGVPRNVRKQVLESFDVRTIGVRQAGASEYGLRYFDNVDAFAKGRYLFATFPASRASLALDPQWNRMTYFTQWQIRPGAMLFEGVASPKGVGLPGGQIQKFVPNLNDLLSP